MKMHTRWYSERVGREVSVVRWGYYGQPVIVFPTAGGDAEEIERFKLVDALGPLIEAGRIKVYSCDSINGRALLVGEGSAQHRAWVQNQFHDFVRHEMVPAIRADCVNDSITIMAAGPSIGAFNALAMVCRYPWEFTHAICMSGTYDLSKWVDGEITDDFYRSSPVHFLPNMNGDALQKLRERYIILASGQGAFENIGESWHVAHLLGQQGIPNRVDPWGLEWEHDWGTWRSMLPHYLNELT